MTFKPDNLTCSLGSAAATPNYNTPVEPFHTPGMGALIDMTFRWHGVSYRVALNTLNGAAEAYRISENGGAEVPLPLTHHVTVSVIIYARQFLEDAVVKLPQSLADGRRLVEIERSMRRANSGQKNGPPKRIAKGDYKRHRQ